MSAIFRAGFSGTVTSAQISDATTFGKNVLKLVPATTSSFVATDADTATTAVILNAADAATGIGVGAGGVGVTKPNLGVSSSNGFVTGSLAVNNLKTVAVGTVYSLTATSAAVTFGTTSPNLTLTATGTFRVRGFVNLKYNGATFAAARTVTIKLRKSNGTPADLTNGSVVFTTSIVTTVTGTFVAITFTSDDYAGTINDVLAIFADVSVIPTAGSLDIIAAFIEAQQIG